MSNFDKIEVSYFQYLNKILKQTETIQQIHQSYRNAATDNISGATATAHSDDHSNKLNVKFKPIEIPVFDPEKTEILSFHDWITLFTNAASNLDDYAMKSCLLQQSLTGEAKSLVSSLPLNELGYTDAIGLLN